MLGNHYRNFICPKHDHIHILLSFCLLLSLKSTKSTCKTLYRYKWTHITVHFLHRHGIQRPTCRWCLFKACNGNVQKNAANVHQIQTSERRMSTTYNNEEEWSKWQGRNDCKPLRSMCSWKYAMWPVNLQQGRRMNENRSMQETVQQTTSS